MVCSLSLIIIILPLEVYLYCWSGRQMTYIKLTVSSCENSSFPFLGKVLLFSSRLSSLETDFAGGTLLSGYWVNEITLSKRSKVIKEPYLNTRIRGLVKFCQGLSGSGSLAWRQHCWESKHQTTFISRKKGDTNARQDDTKSGKDTIVRHSTWSAETTSATHACSTRTSSSKSSWVRDLREQQQTAGGEANKRDTTGSGTTNRTRKSRQSYL